MSEAAGARVAQAELGPATKLIALYADGSDEAVVAAGKLTLGMIAETATWFDGKGDPRAPEAAEKVRAWWLNQVRIADGEDAEELEERWAIAFAKAKGAKPEPEVATPTKTYAEIKAEIAAKRAKAATAISEASAKADAELAAEVAKPAVITKPALSPLLPGFEKLPEAPKPPPGASELERLTYPPGLLGHATDHAFHSTDLPDRQLALWGAKNDDISGGFLNRCLIFDIGVGALDPVEPTRDPDRLEDWFVKALREITRNAAPEQSATPIMSPGPGFEAMGPFTMGWGTGVQEAYLDSVSDVRKLPADSRKRELSIRTPEIALREASKLARLCGARDVWLSHYELAWAWVSRSRDLVLRGANENMNVKRDFKAIGEHMKRLVEEGPMMWTDLRIKSRSAAGPFDLGILDKVRDELVDTGELREIEKEEQVLRGLRKPNQTGPVAHWYIRGPRR